VDTVPRVNPTATEDRGLLDALLQHALASLRADHITFCSWEAATKALTVTAAVGRLGHEEVLVTGEALPADELDYDPYVYVEGNSVPVVYRLGDPGTHSGVQEFLRRVGAATEITIPVFDRPGGQWVLEAYFCDPERPVGADDMHQATTLASLAAVAINRDALVRELRDAETRFRTLAEQIPAIIYANLPDGTPVYTSPKLEELLGIPRSRWMATADSWMDALHPDDQDRVREVVARQKVLGRFDLEYRILAADGRTVWFNDRAATVTDAAGAPAIVQGVMLDITARRTAEGALRDSDARRQQVLEEMLRTEEAVRARIATELHDDTIQVMTAALILLDRVELAAAKEDPQRLAETVHGARDALASAVERTRRMTFELRPPLLEQHGLAAAIRDLADEAATEGGFSVAVDLEVERYPFAIEDLAYRTVQEALANVRRHASANAVSVSLRAVTGELRGKVTDDGRGFDVERALDRSAMRMHLGLDAMRERVQLAGGDLSIDSRPGRGARVEFRIPLARSA
jgi:two-component system, NarL family, sensor histidine kinase UhpB